MHDIFLSHNSADKPAVEALALRLRAAGIEPWLDKWNLIPGNPWQQEIEQAIDTCKVCAVFIGPSGMGPWQDEEMRAAIDRRVSQGNFRVIPVLLPGATRSDHKRSSLPTFLTATTWVEFRDTLEDEDAFHRLLSGIRGVAPGAVSGGDGFTSDECPYRGLQVFDVEHAPLFFGRRALTEWLLEAIRPEEDKANRFLAMLGASGSGKSSLARAGLLAPLQKGELADSQHWPQIILKPGAKPLESLAVALCHAGVTDKNQGELIELFQQNDSQLHWLCRQAVHGQSDNHRIVVLVDQFEEVFTLCQNDDERAAFINNLLTAATDVTGQAIVLLTLRADFYGKCAAYPQLAAALSDDQFLISPMTEAELREAIEMPALRAGCELEAGLVDVLLKDVKDQPGSLPLLEYTLTRLWEQRESRVLRLVDYRELGGLEGALNQRADEVYAGLSAEQQEICRGIFLRLVQPGEGTEDTRRRANLSEFGEDDETVAVVQKLADARLIATQKAAGDVQAFAEVTHEALIRNWGQLREWIEADRENLKQRIQISQAAAEWAEHGEDDAWLLTGTRLGLVEEWFWRATDNLSVLEVRFLAQSQAAHERRVLAEKEEQERQRKSLARTRWLLGMIAVFALLMAVAAGFAWKSTGEAELARKEAQSSADMAKRKEAEALESAEIAQEKEEEAKQNLLEANYNLAKAFESKALPLLPDDEVLSGRKQFNNRKLRDAWLYSLEAAKQVVPSNTEAVGSVLFGRLSSLRQQDLSIARIKTPALMLGSISSLSFSPDGRLVATSGSLDGTVRLWDAESGESVTTLKGHRHNVLSVAFSPNGRFIASGSADNTVRLWDVVSGETMEILQGHGDRVNSVAFGPDGKFIISGSDDSTVRLWDLVSGRNVKILQGHNSPVLSVDFSPDGRGIVSGSADNTVQLWDVASAKSLEIMQDRVGQVRAVAFSLDGKWVASGLSDNSVRLWDIASGENVKILKGHRGDVLSIAFSPDGRFIASGSADNTVRLWDTVSLKGIRTLRGHSDRVLSVAFSSDGKSIVSGSDDGTMRWWDSTSGESMNNLQGHSRPINSVAFSPNGKFVASSSDDNTVRLWDAVSLEGLSILQGHDDMVNSVAFSPDGKLIVSGSSDGSMRLWDVVSGESLKKLKDYSSRSIESVAFSSDGKLIVSGSYNGKVGLWDVVSGEKIKNLYYVDGSVSSVVFSPDGKLIVSGSDNGTVRLWDVVSGKIKNLPAHGRRVTSVAFSPNGKLLASSSSDGTVRLWNIVTGDTIKILEGHDEFITSVTFSPDGLLIASGSADTTVRLWDTVSGKSFGTLQGHIRSINSVAFSPDGKFIVSGSDDNTVRLWDVPRRGGVNTLQGHIRSINSVAFSPDGKFIVSGSDDNTLHLWDALNGKSVKILQGHSQAINSVAFSLDGTLIASGSSDGTAKLWDVVSGENVMTLQGSDNRAINLVTFSSGGGVIALDSSGKIHSWNNLSGGNMVALQDYYGGSALSMAFSQNGKFIAEADGADEHTIRLWDVSSGKSLKILKGHSDRVFSVVFSPNRKFMASVSYDNTVKLWDVGNGELLSTLQQDSVLSTAFSPDGKFIALGAFSDTLRLRDMVTMKDFKKLQGHGQIISSIVFSPNGQLIASVSHDNTVRIWRLNSHTHRMLFDFYPTEVLDALSFIWELGREGLEIVHKPHPPSLFPQMGQHITFTDKTRKFRPLLDAPRPDETKLAQVVRFLEERCAYKHPKRYNCTPATD